MHISFDTLEMVKRLEAKGFKREQAEEIISVVKDVQHDLSTKQDINDLKISTKQDINDLKISTKQDINDLKISTKQDINDLKKEIESSKKDVIIKLGSTLGSAMTIFSIIIGTLIIFVNK